MGDRSGDARLAALGTHLTAGHRLRAEMTDGGLWVRNPAVAGCCTAAVMAEEMITCRARVEDSRQLWFFTSWGEPIAAAYEITNAAVMIKGYLSGRGGTADRAAP